MPQANSLASLAVCIPTYKRTHLLARLIEDLTRQTVQPDRLIIVDGDPDTGEVLSMLRSLPLPASLRVNYLPSNHGNLAYQRYLGWRASTGGDLLLYLDDDLRIRQLDAIERLIAPFLDDAVVGATANITFGNVPIEKDTEALQSRGQTSKLAQWLRRADHYRAGGLTPVGHRVPLSGQGGNYQQIEWLRGGVMAYRADSVRHGMFSEDLFALTHVQCGLGEDTFLSRQIGSAGKLLFASCVEVLHPHSDVPKSYPYKARQLAYATAYSRRFLNDHYRVTEPPHFSDRVALIKSYAGNTILNWWRAFTSFKAYRFAYAWGYTLGALRGLIQKPTAKNLTPDINWWADAEAALANVQIVQSGVEVE